MLCTNPCADYYVDKRILERENGCKRTKPKGKWSNSSHRPSLLGPQYSALRSAPAVFSLSQNPYIDTGYFSRSRSSVPCPARLTASAEPRRGWCLSQAVIPARGGSPDLPAGSPARPSAPRRSAWCTQVGAYLPTGWASSCVKAAQMCLAEQPGRRPLRFRSPAEQGAPHNSVGSLPPGPIGFDEIHAAKQYCPLPVKDGQLDGVLALIQDKKYRFGVPFIGSQGAKC